MTIDKKLEVPEGMFAVCVWDPYPRMDMKDPEIVRIYRREEDASRYAKKMNDEWFRKEVIEKSASQRAREQILRYIIDGSSREIEREYFVMDDQGRRVA